MILEMENQEILQLKKIKISSNFFRIVFRLSEGKYKYYGDKKHLVQPTRGFKGFLNKLKIQIRNRRN